MHHQLCFFTEDAEQFGLNCAVVIHKLVFHGAQNWHEQRNIYPDSTGKKRVWVYNSISGWLQWFEYFTPHQIEYSLNKLVKKGVLVKGQFNKKGYHRPIWYAFVDQEKYFNRTSDCYLNCVKPTSGVVNLGQLEKAVITQPTDKWPKPSKLTTEKSVNNQQLLLEWFDQIFWPRYPLKKEKFRAIKVILKLKPDSDLQAKIMNGLNNQIIERHLKISANQWVADWKHPTTWLNNRCWEDEVQLVVKSPESTNGTDWQTYLAKNKSMIELGYITEQQLYQLWLAKENPPKNNNYQSRGGQWIEGEVIQ